MRRYFANAVAHWRALILTLRRLPGVYRTELSVERARVFLLADLRRGYTPEQSFRLAMQSSGLAPGSQVYEDARRMAEDLAAGVGVGWTEVMK